MNNFWILYLNNKLNGIEWTANIPLELADDVDIEHVFQDEVQAQFPDATLTRDLESCNMEYDNDITCKISWKQISKADYISLVRCLK